MSARVALYWAPQPDDPLHTKGSAWLGRDAETGAALPQQALPGLDIAALTADARGYGLHATLKPPFRLSVPYEVFRAQVLAFCATRRPFALPPLEVSDIHGFLALRESAPCPALQDFADACVRDLDACRAPPTAAEIARRNPRSERQRDYLDRWGYHYVFEEWFFHVTLTRRLDAAERAVVQPALQAFLGDAPARPRRVGFLSIFTQRAPGASFLLAERLPLLG